VGLSAVVDDDAPLTRVQFLVDGVPTGAPLVAEPYAAAWDSARASADRPHVLTAQATDALGRTSLSAGVTLQVDNGPRLTGIGVSPGLTASSVRVVWTSDVPADSQVDFGTTPTYGASTPVDPRPGTQHQIEVTGLLPGTLYHVRVRSRDANGALAVSADQTFSTP
jgi:hypothetical protein